MDNKLLILIFLFLSFPIVAQHSASLHSISRREGLSNGAVNTIAKDAEGYMWFGTWNGLNRFDGTHIITYLPGNNSGTIHNHVIREIHPTLLGPIWMLTNKGLCLYDNIHDRFTSFFNEESEPINYENDIAISYSERYGALASVFGRGIFKYDSLGRQFQAISFDERSLLVSQKIKRILQVQDSVYGLTTDNELIRVSGNHIKTLLRLPLTEALTSSTAVEIKQHSYILITQRSGSAFAVDLGTNEVSRLDIEGEIITSFAPSQKQEMIWVGTENGRIYTLDLSSLKFELPDALQNLHTNNPISTRIISIFESAPDVLWIGTDGNGIYTLKPTEFPNTTLSSEQLTYPIVRALQITQNGDILIGTKGGGIDIFDTNGNHIRKISVKDGLSNNSVLSLHQRKNGTIWAGTDGTGIDIISCDYKSIRNFPRDFLPSNPLVFASVYRILETDDGHIYLGTSGHGAILVEFDPDKGEFPIHYKQMIIDKNITSSEQQNQIVYALAEEKPGIIWIGTRGFGVYRFNTRTQRVIGKYNTSSHPKLINNDDILSLLKDGEGNIWVGSSRGVYSLSPISGDSVKINNMTALSSLENNSIHTIEEDHEGKLWVTTNNGLSFINHTRTSVRSFNQNDGLINFEYSDGASFFDNSSNLLYAGGTQGLDMVKTDELKFSSYFPPIAINQLYIRNLPIEPGDESLLTKRINHQKKLILKYNQNSLKFDVSPLVFWAQERYKISYRIINSDDEWFINPPNQPITIPNLTPGNYTFQMRVSDENGNWSKQIREMYIVINPPFWMTSWAIAIYILLLAGIQFLIFMTYRRRAARKREKALRAFEKKKEEELQNYKFEFFTNVAHEFRTPLTLITSHIHSIIEDTRSEFYNTRLLKVYKNSVKLQRLVVEIMQFRKLEKGKEPIHIQEVKPVELIREVVSDFEWLAQKKNITFKINTPHPGLVFKTDTDKFQRIFTNLISNAIKYNQPGGYVKTGIYLADTRLVVNVEDNGPGIKPEFFQHVFEPFGVSSTDGKGSLPGFRSTGLGLAVTKGLVELLKGTIRVESKPGEGTTFTCVFPDVHHFVSEKRIDEFPEESDEFDILPETDYEKPKDESEKDPGKHLVLLVDDNPEILIVLRDLIQNDYNLIFAENGVEAYHKVLSHKPDLIVSDVMMPEMDGIEFCRKLRDNFDTSHIPLILLTAKAEIEERITGLKAGADSYIPKPFHPEHLRVRIEKLLQFRDEIKTRFSNKEEDSTLLIEFPDPFFQKMLSYIDENIDDEELSADHLTQTLAISKSSLYNKTKSILGTTPHGLINERRLNKASALLRSTSLTVSEIIFQTGFNSRAHFYDLFQRTHGCSPLDYRNKPRKK